MADKAEIRKLVEAFRRNLQQLKEVNVSEAVIRQEYIDHFWELLGWDIHNRQHRTPAQKDVLIEANVSTIEDEKIHARRPDYIFRIDGFPRFISEAKKLTIDLSHDRDAIFQTKSYAWSAQIPFAILTNFEQFRLFDATFKPYNAEPLKGVVPDFDLRFEDYENQWDIIESTFSREAVANGSLESLLAKIKKVRAGRKIRGIDRMLIDLKGVEPVDKTFLKHLEEYRLRFAREIYAENHRMFPEANTKHGAAKLTEVTQRLVDRLVFIRVCEDRSVTPYGKLRSIVNACSKDGRDLYSELCGLFRRLDEQYNGNLFKAHISEQVTISGDLLAAFIRSLYPPEGPYRFDAIGDDILGIIYERFLGSTITVEHNRVDATEKPEVRHAGGVYYTPKFVVDTIIRRVIGSKVEGKSPSEILSLRILDPACGSGSFLIAALQFLYDHCTEYLSTHPKEYKISVSEGPRKKREITIGFKDKDGQWHISPDFRAQLLASCIYGVDIDMQAVEVTIMSLYLKMLEGQLPPNWQKEFLRHKLLPPLDNNIHCGNSLISQTDFDKYWEGKHGTLFGFDEDTRFRINTFDWTSQTRGFGRIFDIKKGFDCIIGNPPYIRVQVLNEWAPEECEFYKANYKSANKGNYDIYVVFIEKGLMLLAPDGLLGFICPNKFWQAKYGEGIREIISKGKNLKSLIDFTDQQVFKGATTYTAIHVLSSALQNNQISFSAIHELNDGQEQCAAIEKKNPRKEIKTYMASHPNYSEPWVFRSESAQNWCQKLSVNTEPLITIASEIFVGLQTSADTVFLFEEYSFGKTTIVAMSKELSRKIEIESELLKPVVRSGNISRYQAVPSALILFPYYVKNDIAKIIPVQLMQQKYPLAWNYLKSNEKLLRSRESGKFDHDEWYGLMRKNLEKWHGPKVMVPYMVTKLGAFYDHENDFYFVNVTTGGFGVRSEKIDPWLLTALLCSNLLDKWFKAQAARFHGGYYGANKQYIENIPIKLPKNKTENDLALRIITNSKRLHVDYKKLQNQISNRERSQLEREIEAHENQIDELVCNLYGVAAEEINKVEQSDGE
jgi:hypothetical protein